MTSWSKIQNDQRLSSITVRVLNANQPSIKKRDWELDVADSQGNEFEVVIWEKHNVGVEWQEDETYRLSNGKGKVWKNGQQRILHSTYDFEVENIEEEVTILVIGDSHIGRSARTNYRGPNCTNEFSEAIQLALYFDVDAIIHAGDVFDDQVTDSQIKQVQRDFQTLNDHGIQFFYILGNHETNRGVDTLENKEIATHLTVQAKTIRDQVDVIGIDQSPADEFSITAANFTLSSHQNQRILVVHQMLDPVRADGEIALSSLINQSMRFDFVIAGHLHDAEMHRWNGIPVLYPGSTADISSKPDSGGPSAWLLTSSTDGINCDQISLPW